MQQVVQDEWYLPHPIFSWWAFVGYGKKVWECHWIIEFGRWQGSQTILVSSWTSEITLLFSDQWLFGGRIFEKWYLPLATEYTRNSIPQPWFHPWFTCYSFTSHQLCIYTTRIHSRDMECLHDWLKTDLGDKWRSLFSFLVITESWRLRDHSR